ncbi:MAG: hypothetical protein C5B57_04545 [Blastocatellia bacterium]|nr:MAG: hypothetical protein C5B57_04545 [Blastocatellia bacterium]
MVTTPPSTTIRRYGRFLGLAAAIVGVLCAVGWLPTERLAGSQAVRAMVAGCVISLVSAALAGLLLVVVSAETPQARMQRGFLAMIIRLAVAFVLGIAAALSGEFARSPLLFWMATAYVALLPLEVRLAIL